MPDEPRYTLVLAPTIAEQVDRWHRAERGRPAPGMPAHLLGWHWVARDVAYMVDRASGYASTPEEARAVARWSIGEPDPEDPDVELVRRGIFDQDLR